MDSLFTLLRLGIGTGKKEDIVAVPFCHFSEKEWISLKFSAVDHGVAAIALDGLNILIDKFGKGLHKSVDDSWWHIFMREWISLMMSIEKANKHQMVVMNDLARVWVESGCNVLVMKGQANGLMYPKPEHRTPGDIDCYLFSNYAKGNDLARTVGARVNEGWYKHSQISYKGEIFENHLFFVHTREGKRSKLLQQDLENSLRAEECNHFPDSEVLIPPVQWSAMFLTYHACTHFLTEGLRLKQILDWAIFIQKEQSYVNWAQYYDFCNHFHLHIFADAITAICVKSFGVEITNDALIYESPFAEKVLHSSLYDGDYIYNAGESLWKSRLHVVKSLFKHRWKYEEIYQQSVWKQLWWYISGYLFHTE